jgi:hypothetical protein
MYWDTGARRLAPQIRLLFLIWRAKANAHRPTMVTVQPSQPNECVLAEAVVLATVPELESSLPPTGPV